MMSVFRCRLNLLQEKKQEKQPEKKKGKAHQEPCPFPPGRKCVYPLADTRARYFSMSRPEGEFGYLSLIS